MCQNETNLPGHRPVTFCFSGVCRVAEEEWFFARPEAVRTTVSFFTVDVLMIIVV
jgi:hypothetical protein